MSKYRNNTLWCTKKVKDFVLTPIKTQQCHLCIDINYLLIVQMYLSQCRALTASVAAKQELLKLI